MEQIAQQEQLTGEPILVQEEVRGVIPSSSCRIDPLYTRPENSLDAARALLNLCNVLSSRTTTNDSNTTSPATNTNNPNSNVRVNTAKRFEIVGSLVRRTSVAMEARLLNQFSETYTTGGACFRSSHGQQS